MKSLFNFIGAVVSALVGGVLVVAFQAPIARHFSGDRLVAEVHAGRWLPFPGPKGEADPWLKELGAYAIKRVDEDEELYTADWEIINNGSKKVDAIKIEFRTIIPNVAIVYQDGKPRKYYKNPNSIKFDAISPGSRTRLKIISIFDQGEKRYYTTEYMRSFSSEGPISFSVNKNRDNYFIDPVTNFIDQRIGPILWGGLLVATLLFSVLTILLGTFAEKIMKDPLVYRKEKKRFDQNPSGYDYFVKK